MSSVGQVVTGEDDEEEEEEEEEVANDSAGPKNVAAPDKREEDIVEDITAEDRAAEDEARESRSARYLRSRNGALQKTARDTISFLFDKVDKRLIAANEVFQRTLRVVQDTSFNVRSANEDLGNLISHTTIATAALSSFKPARLRGDQAKK